MGERLQNSETLAVLNCHMNKHNKQRFKLVLCIHKLYTNEIHYFHFIFFILQPLHTFRPLQGHHQGARKLHSLHIQCFCLLWRLVQFHCHIYYSYLQCLCLKYVKYTEYKILKKFVNFRSKMLKWNMVKKPYCSILKNKEYKVKIVHFVGV
jgi:hypothetical protein